LCREESQPGIEPRLSTPQPITLLFIPARKKKVNKENIEDFVRLRFEVFTAVKTLIVVF
jgi:hypothetical protein